MAVTAKNEPCKPIYFIDETGFDKYLFRAWGRAKRGVKLFAESRGKKFRRVSLVAGKCGHTVAAPMVYEGTMNAALFEAWFEGAFCPEVGEGAIAVVDNASAHNKDRLSAIAGERGIRLIFQPAYSPDLNKIEHFWAWVKGWLSDNMPNYVTLEDGICGAIEYYDKHFFMCSDV